MPIITFRDIAPAIHPSAFVAPNATIIGMVELAEDVSIWYTAVLRGDVEPIRVGARSNVQDGSVLHTDRGFPCVLGEEVTVGHMACVHGCVVGKGSLIGIHATVLTGAELGEGCVVGAGAVVPEHKKFPPRSLILGVPGKVVREVTPEEAERFARGMRHYVENGRAHRALSDEWRRAE
ncbi:MAG: gamma carbonic anhydrase family protein [Candidatus Sumerlaeia bacterium]|nr:gamma carbonic anhydrase family protein [Candidatus Sumerlaeia bacterium]